MNPVERQNKREYDNEMVKDYAITLGCIFLIFLAAVSWS
jgi:hypothetical protein